MIFPSNINVVILAGGLGTRLKSVVNDRPKVMALINGRPFLTYILDQINDAGLKNVVLCVGFMGKYIESEIGLTYKDLSLCYSYEYEPLGTGGALRNVNDLISTDNILIMNGDSYCRCNLKGFYLFHKHYDALATLLLTNVNNADRYGQVSIDNCNRIASFIEKGTLKGPGLINAGIYLIKREVILSMPEGRFVSLEKDVFPSMIEKNFYGFMESAPFLDIGTPEDYSKAECFMQRNTS